MFGSLLIGPELSATPRSSNGWRACTCLAAPTPVRYGVRDVRPPLSLAPRSAAAKPPAVAAKLYVADELSGTVTVIDATTQQKIGAIQLTVRQPLVIPFSPLDIAVAPNGGSIWITAPQPQSGCAGGDAGCGDAPIPAEYAIDEVVVVDPITDSIVARIKIPSLDTGMVHVSGVVLDRDSRYAYVTASAANQIVRIDAQTYEILGRVDLGPGREANDIEICGDELVVANGFGGKSLSLVSTQTGAVDEVLVEGVPLHVACSPDARFAYASLFDTREVVSYEFATGALTRIALPEGAQGPVQLFPTADGTKIWVCDLGTFYGRMPSDKLYEIDVAKGKVVGEITVGRGPTGLVLTDGGKKAFVNSFLTGSMSVVDLAKGKLDPTPVIVGTGPKGIGLWSASLVQ